MRSNPYKQEFIRVKDCNGQKLHMTTENELELTELLDQCHTFLFWLKMREDLNPNKTPLYKKIRDFLVSTLGLITPDNTRRRRASIVSASKALSLGLYTRDQKESSEAYNQAMDTLLETAADRDPTFSKLLDDFQQENQCSPYELATSLSTLRVLPPGPFLWRDVSLKVELQRFEPGKMHHEVVCSQSGVEEHHKKLARVAIFQALCSLEELDKSAEQPEKNDAWVISEDVNVTLESSSKFLCKKNGFTFLSLCKGQENRNKLYNLMEDLKLRSRL